jgi:hypothetical protein
MKEPKPFENSYGNDKNVWAFRPTAVVKKLKNLEILFGRVTHLPNGIGHIIGNQQ